MRVQQREADLPGQRRELPRLGLLRFQFPQQGLRQREGGIGQRSGIDARSFPAQEVLRPVRARAGRLGGTRRHEARKCNNCHVSEALRGTGVHARLAREVAAVRLAGSLPPGAARYCAGQYNR